MTMMMMPTAEECIRSQMGAEELVLENMGLTSLQPYIGLLSQMPHLRVLRLAHNQLVDLPDDMSSLAWVETLDMSHNPVKSADAVISGLASLPRLRELSVHFQDQKDEDTVIISLMALQSFNGTYLGGEEADGAAIDLSAGLSAPVYSHPPLAPTSATAAPATASSPLPTATTAVSPSTGTATPEVESLHPWTDADALHQAVVSGLPARVQSAEPYPAFKERVLRYLHLLTAAEREPEVQAGEVLKARRVLADYSLEEMLSGAEAALLAKNAADAASASTTTSGYQGMKDGVEGSISSAFVQSLRAIQRHYARLLDDYDRHWRQMAQQQERRTAAMRGELANALEDVEALISAAKQQRRQTPATMSSLRHEDMGRGGAGAGAGGGAPAPEHVHRDAHAMASGAFSGQVRAKPHPVDSRARSTTGASSSTQQKRSVSKSSAYPYPNSASNLNSTSNKKVLTLRQLLDMIDNIYTSKEKYDQRCAMHELPHETMEQHMYTYLNQRYGLREIIVEYATAIIEGVKRYATEQNEVAVFAKILRNEVDEGFRTVQQQIRTTAPELLRFHLKEKHPGRSDQDIQTLVQQRMEAGGELSEQEWTFIAEYMYAPEDAAFLKELVLQDIERQRSSAGGVSTAITPRAASAMPAAAAGPRNRKYSYHSFIRLLLDFQLDGHERFLAPFVRIFRRHDMDGDGVINRDELFAIIREVVRPSPSSDGMTWSDAQESESCRIFDRCVAETCELITFSEAVGVLGEEIAMLGATRQE